MSKEQAIPLWGRNECIRGYALVDVADAALVGDERWGLGSNGYAVRYVKYCGVVRAVLMHRAVMGEPLFAGAEVDHINRNRLDNRRSNLRWVDHRQQMHNKSTYRNNRSGHRGVVWLEREQKWEARVKLNGRWAWRRKFTDVAVAATEVASARLRLMTHVAA